VAHVKAKFRLGCVDELPGSQSNQTGIGGELVNDIVHEKEERDEWGVLFWPSNGY
jgi:hypothetical protein